MIDQSQGLNNGFLFPPLPWQLGGPSWATKNDSACSHLMKKQVRVETFESLQVYPEKFLEAATAKMNCFLNKQRHIVHQLGTILIERTPGFCCRTVLDLQGTVMDVKS